MKWLRPFKLKPEILRIDFSVTTYAPPPSQLLPPGSAAPPARPPPPRARPPASLTSSASLRPTGPRSRSTRTSPRRAVLAAPPAAFGRARLPDPAWLQSRPPLVHRPPPPAAVPQHRSRLQRPRRKPKRGGNLGGASGPPGRRSSGVCGGPPGNRRPGKRPGSPSHACAEESVRACAPGRWGGRRSAWGTRSPRRSRSV